MTYTANLSKASSEKNFLVIIEPAIKVSTWTLESGTIYSSSFDLSNKLIEYATRLSENGVFLTHVTSVSPSSGEWHFDFDNKKIYLNIGSDPSSEYITVFFELYLGTKSENTYRDPLDSGQRVVYFEPRIGNGLSIPTLVNDDLQIFGSTQGSANLNNVDGSLYIYDQVSLKNKSIKIYHYIDSVSDISLIYSGKIEEFSLDDSSLSIRYRNTDFLFNQNFNSYFYTGTDSSKGFFNLTDFPNVDDKYKNYAIRSIYGRVDDILPVNISFNDAPTTSNNRSHVIRAQGSETHALSYSVLSSPSSTTTRVYIGSHLIQHDDMIEVTVSGTPEYRFISAIGSDYIEVSPVLSGAPINTDTVERGTVGKIKLRDENGVIYGLAYKRDWTESVGANNTLQITLANNFETNHAITTFLPDQHTLFCRCYGPKHGSVNDTDLGNMAHAGYVIADILENNLKLLASDFDQTEIEAITTKALGFSIPEDLTESFPTYREVIKKINASILGQFYFNANKKLSYKTLDPMGASVQIIDDSQILSFSSEYDGDQIYSLVKILYDRKEAINGNFLKNHSVEQSINNDAMYLHQVENEFKLETYLVKQADALSMANRYGFLYSSWNIKYNLQASLELQESVLNDPITVEREKLNGYNYIQGTKNTKKINIKTVKKTLSSTSITATDQRGVEDNSGSW